MTDSFLFSYEGDASATKLCCVWLVDSGAAQHIKYSKDHMKTYKVSSLVDVHLADDGVVRSSENG